MTTMVIFQCGSARCALPSAIADRVTPLPALSHPPTTPPILAGIMDLGGEATPVVRAAALFGLEEADLDAFYRHVLVVETAAGRIGLLVDRVLDVRDVETSAMTPADPAVSLHACVAGDLMVGADTVHLLDPERLFTAAEQARLQDLKTGEETRRALWGDA